MSTNNDKPFEKGEIIEYCGEHHEVVDNYGSSGVVKYPNDPDNDQFKFYWNIYGEECRRVQTNSEGK